MSVPIILPISSVLGSLNGVGVSQVMWWIWGNWTFRPLNVSSLKCFVPRRCHETPHRPHQRQMGARLQ